VHARNEAGEVSRRAGAPTGEERHTLDDLEAFLTREMAEYERRVDAYRITHTVQVTSFGGSGTTALCQHLLQAGVDLQPGPGQWPFKHRRQPPEAGEVPDGFRVLYLVGDPRDAVLSIFRRHFQFGHYGALHGHEPDDEVRARLHDLDTFLAAGIDDFALAEHVDGWLTHPDGYPVLVVRYDALREVWPEVAAFVGLPPDYPCLAVRPRNSNSRRVPAGVRDRLDEMYGALAARIDAFPPAHLAPGRHGAGTVTRRTDDR
jgi:hypothetical protein